MLEERLTNEIILNKRIMAGVRKASLWMTTISLIVVDSFSISLAFFIAVLVRDAFEGQLSRQLYFSLWPFLFLFPLVYYLSGLYQLGISAADELRRLTYITSINFIALGAITFIYKVGILYSRAVFILAFGLAIIFVPLGRAIIRAIFAQQFWWGANVIVLGAGKTGELVIDNLLSHPSLGLKPIALLDDDTAKHGLTIRGVPVRGGLDKALDYAQQGIHYAILAMPGVERKRSLEITQRMMKYFSHLIIIPDLFGYASLWVQSQDLSGILGLQLRQQLLMPYPRLIKRAMDVGLILIFSPLLIILCSILAILIKLDSEGPVFYGQRRVGKDGRLFTAWKFRTMVQNAEQVLDLYLKQNPEFQKEWQQKQKLRNDPRVTRIGRFLRKTSLDELPQIWNVVRGEMSLVGPRPMIEDQISLYGDIYDLYCQVLPGITGLWQVSGRNETTFQERVSLEAYYVRNWSPWLDIIILARTVLVVLTGKGAY
jgi:Undecaprenyl-phosphate galactose phosphotransferase WbaP